MLLVGLRQMRDVSYTFDGASPAPFIPKGRLTRRIINRLHLMIDYTIQITRQTIESIWNEFGTFPWCNIQRATVPLSGRGNGPGEGAHTGHNLAGASLAGSISWSRFSRRSYVGRDGSFVTFCLQKERKEKITSSFVEAQNVEINKGENNRQEKLSTRAERWPKVSYPPAPFIPKGKLTRRVINAILCLKRYTLTMIRQLNPKSCDDFKKKPFGEIETTIMLLSGRGNGPGEGGGASFAGSISWSRLFVSFWSQKERNKKC